MHIKDHGCTTRIAMRLTTAAWLINCNTQCLVVVDCAWLRIRNAGYQLNCGNHAEFFVLMANETAQW